MRLASQAVRDDVTDLVRALPSTERERIERMGESFEARARAEAYVLLRELIGASGDSVVVEYAEDGRPRVSGAATGSPVDVSISHAGGRVLVGVCESPQRIGVDIMSIHQALDPDGFLRNAVHPPEMQILERLTGSGLSLRTALIVLWSIKEAAAKCSGAEFVPRDIRLTGRRTDGSVCVTSVTTPKGAVTAGWQLRGTFVESWALQG